jgi:hypothetical protein
METNNQKDIHYTYDNHHVVINHHIKKDKLCSVRSPQKNNNKTIGDSRHRTAGLEPWTSVSVGEANTTEPK